MLDALHGGIASLRQGIAGRSAGGRLAQQGQHRVSIGYVQAIWALLAGRWQAGGMLPQHTGIPWALLSGHQPRKTKNSHRQNIAAHLQVVLGRPQELRACTIWGGLPIELWHRAAWPACMHYAGQTAVNGLHSCCRRGCPKASSLMNACRRYLVCCRQAGRPLLAACSLLQLASLANCIPLWAKALRDMVAHVQQTQLHLISTAMQTIRRAGTLSGQSNVTVAV